LGYMAAGGFVNVVEMAAIYRGSLRRSGRRIPGESPDGDHSLEWGSAAPMREVRQETHTHTPSRSGTPVNWSEKGDPVAGLLERGLLDGLLGAWELGACDARVKRMN
jgi:hypothetical protein